jgi:hypothetical protein
MSGPPDNREGRPGDRTGSGLNISTAIKNESSLAAALDNLPHMTRRLLQEAISDAWAPQQRARAAAWRAAAPRPGDFRGRATTADLRAAWTRCNTVADAFENRAAISPEHLVSADLENVLREVA